VVRNRVRRRLRAAVQELGAQLGPGAYLFGADQSVVTMPFLALTASVAEVVHEATGQR
jgi:ribonuclease P protein component